MVNDNRTQSPERLQIVLLADTHLTLKGQSLFGIDVRARLDRAISLINQMHQDAASTIILGDLAHHGSIAAYRELADALAPLTTPVQLMLGNHDQRAAFRDVFGNQGFDESGFLQSVTTFDQATLVTLDTLDEDGGTAAGRLCERRLEWLADTLRCARADRPLFLFMHHPPFPIGTSAFDKIGLTNRQDLWETFERAGRQPTQIICGHIHRSLSGLWQGVPVATLRALAHQMRDGPPSCPIEGTLEAPGYALLTVTSDTVTLSDRTLGYDGPVFSPRSQNSPEQAQKTERNLG